MLFRSKLMTIFLIPSFFMRWNRVATLVAMLIGLLAVMTQREILSWYWIWILPFISFFPEYPLVIMVSGVISFSLLVRYVPFLFFGHWNDPVPMYKNILSVVPIGIVLIVVLFRQLYRLSHQQRDTHKS